MHFLAVFLILHKKIISLSSWNVKLPLISEESGIWFNGLGANEVFNVFFIVIVEVSLGTEQGFS